MEEKAVNQGKLRKQSYWAKLQQCLDEYKNILVIGVDFVGSQQLQETRIMLRGKARMLMGKNTIIRKVFRERIEAGQTGLEALLPAIYGNIGFVFTNGDLAPLRKLVTEKKLPAAAKAGVVAPKDVIIPAGPSGLDPGQTSFFQALNIGTKIVKGSIELLNDVTVARAGQKVSTSAVALLNKLALKPFEYGITASHVYENGAVYTVEVLDMTDDALDLIAMGKIRQEMLPGGIERYSRSAMYKKKGAYKKLGQPQAAKTTVSNAQTTKVKPVGGDKNGKERTVVVNKESRYYPVVDVPVKNKKKKQQKIKFRESLQPGTVCILLSGRFKGKRTVLLKTLPSGLILVSGPFKLNGVPLKRVDPAYVIATQTRIDISKVNLPESLTDDFFRRPDEARGDGNGVLENKEDEAKSVDPKRAALQKEVDGALSKAINDPMMTDYLRSSFSLRKGQYPHEMVF